jgi:hypothetical protein
VGGCNEAIKKPYAIDEYVPKDANEATAMTIYRNALFAGELAAQKAKDAAAATLAAEKQFAWLSVACTVGMVASIFCIVLGVKVWGIAGLIACGAGLGLAWAGVRYSAYLGIGGLVISVLAAAYAAYSIITELVQHKTALKEVVTGVQNALRDTSTRTGEQAIKEEQKAVQSPTTTALVDTIRAELLPNK